MDNRELIQQSIDYIEENLKAELTADELSRMAGFSLFHYYRLFQNAVGLPVMQYILRRRLINAIYEISQGQKMIDTALAYGFNTHAGFFKAFRREYGGSPSCYLEQHSAKKPYKICLKQEEHIMITHKKAAEILARWGLENEPIADIYYDGTGNRSENAFYVGEHSVLKFTANPGALKKHIEISKALHNAGLETAMPIADKNSQEYVQDGELYFMLTKRLQGAQLKSEDFYLSDSQDKARYLGEIIGQLHGVLKTYEDPLCSRANLLESVSSWALPKATEIMGLPQSFGGAYLEAFGKLFPELPQQIIHRDPNPGNIIFANGKLAGFIDFELSEINVRIFDPCYAATAILSESISSDEFPDKWVRIYHEIIQGYDSVAKLTKAEKQAIPYVIFAIQMICVAYFFGIEKFCEQSETNIKMTRWLIENRARLAIE